MRIAIVEDDFEDLIRVYARFRENHTLDVHYIPPEDIIGDGYLVDGISKILQGAGFETTKLMVAKQNRQNGFYFSLDRSLLTDPGIDFYIIDGLNGMAFSLISHYDLPRDRLGIISTDTDIQAYAKKLGLINRDKQPANVREVIESFIRR